MQGAERRGSGGSAIVAVLLFACLPAGIGCAGRCRVDDPKKVAAFDAVWRNDIASMRRLIAEDPTLANATLCPPREHIYSRMISWGIGAGASTLIHVAARQGHAELASFLIEAGAEVDARDGVGGTPLHQAAEYGHDEVARLLLAANATVDARRSGGLTPLHMASGHGRFPVAKRLLAAGADANAKEGGAWTPLHRAASEGHDNLVRLLLEQGGDPASADDHGATPLQYAVLHRHQAVVELLTVKSATAPGSDRSRSSAFVNAARDGDPENVRLLLGTGVNVDSRDPYGRTALQLAIDRGPGGGGEWEEARTREQHEVVDLLIAAGADLEVRGASGNRPLHQAAMFGRTEIAAKLIAARRRCQRAQRVELDAAAFRGDTTSPGDGQAAARARRRCARQEQKRGDRPHSRLQRSGNRAAAHQRRRAVTGGRQGLRGRTGERPRRVAANVV